MRRQFPTENCTNHEDDRAFLSDCVQEYLRDGLTRWSRNSRIKVLNGEQ